MSWLGRILGVIFGVFLAGPIGALLGFWFGYQFDRGLRTQAVSRAEEQARVQGAFFDAVFSVMGHIAKLDGRVSEAEIRQAQRTMEQMGLNRTMRLRAIRLFNQGKRSDFRLEAALGVFKQSCGGHPALLRFFVETQLQLAYVDGTLSQHERWALQYLCQQLGFTFADFQWFNDWVRAEQRRQRPAPPPDPSSLLAEAYRLLGVASTVGDHAVKRAYRRLMSQHHPDKLIAQGVPESMVKAATRKTQEIKAAYERVCEARARAASL